MCGICEGMKLMQGFLRVSDSQILERGVGRMKDWTAVFLRR